MQPGPQPFKVEALESPSGARIFKLEGPLTLQSLFEFQSFVRQERTKPVIVDLSGVDYMDSAGLGSVISIYTSCQQSQRGFAITGLTERIRTLFKVTNVEGLLPCFDTMAEAEQAVRS